MSETKHAMERDAAIERLCEEVASDLSFRVPRGESDDDDRDPVYVTITGRLHQLRFTIDWIGNECTVRYELGGNLKAKGETS